MSCSSSGQLERLGQLRRSFGVWGLQAAAWICGRKLLPRSILLHASPLRLFCRVILAPSAATGWAIACRVAREPQGTPGKWRQPKQAQRLLPHRPRAPRAPRAQGPSIDPSSSSQEKMAKTEICRFNSDLAKALDCDTVICGLEFRSLEHGTLASTLVAL